MNRRGHEALGVGCWVVGSAVADLAAWHFGHTPSALLVATQLASTYFARATSAGKNSPDVDRIWAPGLPERGYHWSGHRGFTHRVWFASVFTLIVTVAFVAAARYVPMDLATAVFSPAVGWWSHLLGDMLKGRLKVGRRRVGLGSWGS